MSKTAKKVVKAPVKAVKKAVDVSLAPVRASPSVPKFPEQSLADFPTRNFQPIQQPQVIVQHIPLPAPPPPPPTIQQARQSAPKPSLFGRGRPSTIASGPQGDTSPTPGRRKTLFGQ